MKLTALQVDKHRDLKLRRVNSYQHASAADSIKLAKEEINRAALSYPVLFSRSEENIFYPVALLSVVQNENQYLDGDEWKATYLPAALRAYPFKFAGEQVLIDESSPQFDKQEGEALFDENGNPSPLLDQALGFLRACYGAEDETRSWCKHLEELDLLVERGLEVVSPQGARYSLRGFYVVDAEKVPLLPDAKLSVLVRDGSMALIDAHLLSLQHLITLAAQRDDIDDGTGEQNAEKGEGAVEFATEEKSSS